MIVKDIIESDVCNYKKISMYIIFPYCSFKCDIENGNQYCQNYALSLEKDINISVQSIVSKYIKNELSTAIVCAGLEPFDSWDDLYDLVIAIRKCTDDDIVIYTGFTEDEIKDKIDILKNYKNIVVKFGRYRPNQEKHFDEELGVYLASDNQYARRIS